MLCLVLALAACLLWFMNGAMQNDRLAVREELAGAYRGTLMAAQARLARHWTDMAAALDNVPLDTSAAAAFASCLRSARVDSVLLFDPQGRLLYPDTAVAVETDWGPLEAAWAEAGSLERVQKDQIAAAARYGEIATASTNANLAARALQAQTRCLLQAGQTNAAIGLITGPLEEERFRLASDAQGRGIVANSELLALELLRDSAAPLFRTTAAKLTRRLTDYTQSTIAAPQRRFLLQELKRLAPAQETTSMLPAEELAAQAAERHLRPSRDPVLRASALPGVWQFAANGGRVLGLCRQETLRAELHRAVAGSEVPPEVRVAVSPPTAESGGGLLSLPAGSFLPGWRVTLSLNDERVFETAARHEVAARLWVGLLLIALICVFALGVAQAVGQQAALARLKNNLVANVSHELKTPLASMRLLVDTLLSAENLPERTVREYLELISGENARLGRLVDSFLTFSRLERGQYPFRFEAVAPGRIVEQAVEATRPRWESAGRRLGVEIEPELPPIRADAEALTIAVSNLVDNACKYSKSIERIVLRARARDGKVAFVVEDDGVGISWRDRQRIFRRFYQVDQTLSRGTGGCGLGLSIVQFIIRAHAGSVRVESELGRGSVFTLLVPAVTVAAIPPKTSLP